MVSLETIAGIAIKVLKLVRRTLLLFFLLFHYILLYAYLYQSEACRVNNSET